MNMHVPRNGSVRGAGTGLEPSLGYDCSRCRGSLPATMNEWLPARVMCVSSPPRYGIPCGAPRCPNSCYIYGRPERDADYLPTYLLVRRGLRTGTPGTCSARTSPSNPAPSPSGHPLLSDRSSDP